MRFAGADPLWAGCHDFSPLSGREAAKPKAARQGPRNDELGLFATLISRIGPGLNQRIAAYLRAAGEADILDIVRQLEESDGVRRLAALDVQNAFASLWPQLTALRARRSAPGVRSR